MDVRNNLTKPRETFMLRILSLACLTGLALASPAEEPMRTEVEKKALDKVRQLGGFAMELAQNDTRLDVAFHLMDKKITAEHLTPLKDLSKSLVYLNLRGTETNDELLANVAGLTSLTRLHLEKTKITDKGLVHLKGLVNLEYLNLYGTEITDAGLANLEGMKKLKNLYLWQTKVTDAGVDKLKKALPQLQIIRGEEPKPMKTS
jgi:hypothetical protein